MKFRAWMVVGVASAGLATPQAAEACGGGGVVSSQAGTIGANTQRIVLAGPSEAAAGGPPMTDVVVQIGVPNTTDDYGALLPVPSEPTLDPSPIASEELDQLDAATAPQIFESSGDDDGGCGCITTGAAEGVKGERGGDDGSVRASRPVNIGPVTAVVLSGGAAAVGTWLDENGFAIAADRQALIQEYSTYGGGYFIAIRRNDGVVGGPTSIGVHFTMPGDHRQLPLRFARLGAAETVGFTVFVVAPETVGPSSPFVALTLGDLSAGALRRGDYAGAVKAAVREHDDKAFVVESSTPKSELFLSGTRLATLFRASTVTRLSTVISADALTEDVQFHDPFAGAVPRERHVLSASAVGYRAVGMGSLAAVLAAGLLRRRTRRRALSR